MGDGWGSTSDVPSPRPPQQLIIASKVIDTSFVSETGLTYEHVRTFRALSKSMKLFDDIDVQALDELSLIMKPLEFRSGEQLIKEGDSLSSLGASTSSSRATSSSPSSRASTLARFRCCCR